MIEIRIENSQYPDALRKIKNPPKQLYLEGNIELLNKNSIAIIGSRNCSENGKILAKKFAKELVEQGLTIISGMAKTFKTRLGLILKIVFGRNSPVTRIIRVEITVCANTIRK